jgi:starvation-inducible DNA-binding protein
MSTSYVTDLKINTRKSMIELLNVRLADAIDLKLAVKQAHWNIRGSAFIALHELLDRIAARIEEHGDTMAERIVQIGGIAGGTLQQVSKATSLPAYPGEIAAQADHLAALCDRFQEFAKSCRAAIDQASDAGDADTADIMTGVSRNTDKDLWFIAAHLG